MRVDGNRPNGLEAPLLWRVTLTGRATAVHPAPYV
jgi:hypothetical protein